MHKAAEYGIAAHWMYKEGRSNPDDLDSKLAWLREALSLEADSNTTREFIENIRKDFFGDYVYVLTPQGKIIDLVTGSTPIDFAYRIHSNVGNHVQHAKVNGALVRLDYKLKNNDVVEIITSPNAAPSYDWLKIAGQGKNTHVVQEGQPGGEHTAGQGYALRGAEAPGRAAKRLYRQEGILRGHIKKVQYVRSGRRVCLNRLRRHNYRAGDKQAS